MRDERATAFGRLPAPPQRADHAQEGQMTPTAYEVPPGSIVPDPDRSLDRGTHTRPNYQVTVDADGLRLIEIARTVLVADSAERVRLALEADEPHRVEQLHAELHRLIWFWAPDTRGTNRIDIARSILARDGTVTLSYPAVREILAGAAQHPDLAEIHAALHARPDAVGALVAA